MLMYVLMCVYICKTYMCYVLKQCHVVAHVCHADTVSCGHSVMWTQCRVVTQCHVVTHVPKEVEKICQFFIFFIRITVNNSQWLQLIKK